MKVVYTKASMVLTCICVLQASVTSAAAEATAAKPQSSLLSKLKQKAKDKAASITSAVKSKIKRGIKVKLIKVNEEERKQRWLCQVINHNNNAVVGNRIEFYKDTTVTLDPEITKQTVQVFVSPNASGTPDESIDIEIDHGTIKNKDVKNNVLAVSHTTKDLPNYVRLEKGIRWMAKTKADQFIAKQKELGLLQNIRERIQELNKKFVDEKVQEFINESDKIIKSGGHKQKGESRLGLAYKRWQKDNKINALSFLKQCVEILKLMKSGLKKIDTYPQTFELVSSSLKKLEETYKELYSIAIRHDYPEYQKTEIEAFDIAQALFAYNDTFTEKLSNTFEKEFKAAHAAAQQAEAGQHTALEY